MKIRKSQKYIPMLTVLHFIIIGLFISIFLGTIKHFLDGTPFLKMLEAPIFMSIVAVFIGYAYCEISYRIKNLLLGTISFGIVSSNIFYFLLPISSYILDRDINREITLNTYLLTTLFGGTLLGLIYFGIKSKKFNNR